MSPTPRRAYERRTFADVLRALWAQKTATQSQADQSLIEEYDLTVAFRCPCGSRILHLVRHVEQTVDCPRCQRRIGVQLMTYLRDTRVYNPGIQFVIGPV